MLNLLFGVLAAASAAGPIPRGEIPWNLSVLTAGSQTRAVTLGPAGLSLAAKAGGFEKEGSFTSPPLPTAFDANYYGILLDMGNSAPETLDLEVRHLRTAGSWSSWRKLGHFDRLADSPETPPDKRKYHSHGPILDSRGIQAIQWRATLRNPGGHAPPLIKEIRISYADTRKRGFPSP